MTACDSLVYPQPPFFMFLLYLDDSGSPKDSSQSHFVLAGFAVFERQPYFLNRDVESVAARLSPDAPSEVEFHCSPMLKGAGRWRRLPKDTRLSLLEELLTMLTSNRYARISLFGAAIEKEALARRTNSDVVEYAFEQLCSRFDQFLGRRHLEGDTHRGLIILDKHRAEVRLQTLAREFGTRGHTWGRTRNMAEVPMFVDSRATRLIQLADIVAHAVFRRYERDDDRLFRIIAPHFDREGRVLHGLHHFCAQPNTCPCAACASRRP